MDAEAIKSWLESHRRDRQWLAEQCGVQLATVNGWLSANRKIGPAAKKRIQDLMHGPPRIEPKFPIPIVLEMIEAAEDEHLAGPEEWMQKTLLAALADRKQQKLRGASIIGKEIAKIVKFDDETPSEKVAEDP